MLVNLAAVRGIGVLHGLKTLKNPDGVTGFVAISSRVLRDKGCLAAWAGDWVRPPEPRVAPVLASLPLPPPPLAPPDMFGDLNLGSGGAYNNNH